MVRAKMALLFMLICIFVLWTLRLPVIERFPVCFEVNEWVFDEESRRCLVRFRRTHSSTSAIVSGKSIKEMEARAKCNFNVLSKSIEDDCWKGTGVLNRWMNGKLHL